MPEQEGGCPSPSSEILAEVAQQTLQDLTKPAVEALSPFRDILSKTTPLATPTSIDSSISVHYLPFYESYQIHSWLRSQDYRTNLQHLTMRTRHLISLVLIVLASVYLETIQICFSRHSL